LKLFQNNFISHVTTALQCCVIIFCVIVAQLQFIQADTPQQQNC